MRSINTSLTVTLTLLALYFYRRLDDQGVRPGPPDRRVSGTYSSIFNASQLLVAWENGEIKRLFGRLRGRNSGPIVAPSR